VRARTVAKKNVPGPIDDEPERKNIKRIEGKKNLPRWTTQSPGEDELNRRGGEKKKEKTIHFRTGGKE